MGLGGSWGVMMSDYRSGLVVRSWHMVGCWSVLGSLVWLWLVDDRLGGRGDWCVGGLGVRGHLVGCLVVRRLDNVMRHECLSVGHCVVHNGVGAQWLEAGLGLIVLVQVVIAGQVMLAVVLLCERLVVPSLMVILVVHLGLNGVLLAHSPGVHRGAFFFVDWLVLTVCDDFMLNGVGMRVADFMLNWVGMRVALAAIERQQCVLHVVVFDAVLRLSLDLVEQLVVLVLNIVHQLRALVVVNIVAVGVATVVSMFRSIMPEVLIRLVMVIVVITAPVWATLMVVTVMLGFVTMVIKAALIMVCVVGRSGLSVDIVSVVLRIMFLVMSLLADVLEVSIEAAISVEMWLLVGRHESSPLVSLTQMCSPLVSVAVVDIVLAVVMVLSSHFVLRVAHCVQHISQVSHFVMRNDRLTIVMNVFSTWVLAVVQVSVEKFLVRRQGPNVLMFDFMADMREWNHLRLRNVVPILVMAIINHTFNLNNDVISAIVAMAVLVRSHIVVSDATSMDRKIVSNGIGATVMSRSIVLFLVDVSVSEHVAVVVIR